MRLLLTGLILSVIAPPLTAEQAQRTNPRQRPVPTRSQVHKLEELTSPPSSPSLAPMLNEEAWRSDEKSKGVSWTCRAC